MKMVALLKGINVGGNRKVPMPELKKLAAGLSFTEIETYINSGNLIFVAHKISSAKAESQLEAAIEKHFGFHVDVVVRTLRDWKTLSEAMPFQKAGKERPHLLHVAIAKRPWPKSSLSMLAQRTGANDLLKFAGGELWIDFGSGVARSKLSPQQLDRAAGSPVTMRNWRTVLKLASILEITEN